VGELGIFAGIISIPMNSQYSIFSSCTSSLHGLRLEGSICSVMQPGLVGVGKFYFREVKASLVDNIGP